MTITQGNAQLVRLDEIKTQVANLNSTYPTESRKIVGLDMKKEKGKGKENRKLD